MMIDTASSWLLCNDTVLFFLSLLTFHVGAEDWKNLTGINPLLLGIRGSQGEIGKR